MINPLTGLEEEQDLLGNGQTPDAPFFQDLSTADQPRMDEKDPYSISAMVRNKIMQEKAIKDAGRQVASNELTAGLGQSATQIGNAIAGVAPASNMAGWENLQKTADEPLKREQVRQAIQDKFSTKMMDVQSKKDALKEGALNRASLAAQRKDAKDQAQEIRKDEKTTKRADELSKQLTGHETYKNAEGAMIAYNQMQQAYKNPSPYGDIAAVYTFMKALDPTSTVREGEYATAKNAGGIPESLRNTVNKAIGSGFLGKEQLKDMMNISGRTAKSRVDSYNAFKAPIIARAEKAGINTVEIDPFNDARVLDQISGSTDNVAPKTTAPAGVDYNSYLKRPKGQGKAL